MGATITTAWPPEVIRLVKRFYKRRMRKEIACMLDKFHPLPRRKKWTTIRVNYILRHKRWWGKRHDPYLKKRYTVIHYGLNPKLRWRGDYWNSDQKQFLIDNYVDYGDWELPELFKRQFPGYFWNQKIIRDKLRYLKLTRTKDQRARIFQKALEQKRFKGPRKYKEGEIFTSQHGGYRTHYIALNGSQKTLGRYLWEQAGREVEKGFRLHLKAESKNKPAATLAADDYEKLPDMILAANATKDLSDGFVAARIIRDQELLLGKGVKDLKADPELRQKLKQQLIADESMIALHRAKLKAGRSLKKRDRTNEIKRNKQKRNS